MASEDEREIYWQRFESERSWYRLEWQLFQVGVAIGLVTLGLGDEAFKPEWWQLLIGGAVFVKFSYAMQRISKGFRDNREKLRVYASRVGDYIPKGSSKPLESAAVRSRLLLHTVGVMLVIYGVRNPDFTLYDTPFAKRALTALMISELILWFSWQVIDAHKWAQPIIPVIRWGLCIIGILIILLTVVILISWRFF